MAGGAEDINVEAIEAKDSDHSVLEDEVEANCQEDGSRRVIEAMAAGRGPRLLYCRVQSGWRSSLRL